MATIRTEKGSTLASRAVRATALCVALSLAACRPAPVEEVSPSTTMSSAPNHLTAAERAAGWRLLFDGRSLSGWRGLGYPGVPEGHWTVEDGAIKKIATAKVAPRADGQRPRGGDLMTQETFGDFELAWEWKISAGGNSGLKYNVSEELSGGQPSNVLRPATGSSGVSHSAIGFEYQMLDDDRHSDGRLVTHRSGALYDILTPNDRKRLKPVGEWNQSRVVFVGRRGEHWLNGEKIVEYELGSRVMDSALAASKFRTTPWFAQRRAGHIVLQDHGDEVWVRSIKLRAVKP